jgi:hypothetical protein
VQLTRDGNPSLTELRQLIRLPSQLPPVLQSALVFAILSSFLLMFLPLLILSILEVIFSTPPLEPW